MQQPARSGFVHARDAREFLQVETELEFQAQHFLLLVRQPCEGPVRGKSAKAVASSAELVDSSDSRDSGENDTDEEASA